MAWIAAFLWLGLWLAWFVGADVPVHAVSDEARLEADRRPRRLAVSTAGIVVQVDGELGQAVQAGQLLIRLDDEDVQARLTELEARREAALGSIEALEARRRSEQARIAQIDRSTGSATAEQGHRRRQAEAALKDAEAEVDRLRPLVDQGILGRAELERAEGRVDQLRPAVAAETAAVERRRGEAGVDLATSRAQLSALDAELVRERGAVATWDAQIRGLRHDLTRFRLAAPVDGVLGSFNDLSPGDRVGVGEVIGSVVPDGELRIVAFATPSVAAGRIQVGQSATVSLDGFPWTQYGKLAATVVQVASEPGSGRIRFVLRPDPAPGSPLPLQHGLPGRVEVEVERARPIELVLRSAGRRLAPAGTASP